MKVDSNRETEVPSSRHRGRRCQRRCQLLHCLMTDADSVRHELKATYFNIEIFHSPAG